MRTQLFIMALTAGLLGFSSCNNNDEPAVNENVRMRQVTLTASIGGDDASTRTSYEYDATNKILKGMWEAGDMLSVITIDAEGKATGVYNLTSNNTAPAATADFTGTMPAKGSYASLLCVYPAITENITDASADWKTSDAFISIRASKRKTLSIRGHTLYQTGNDNVDHIKAKDFMIGVPTITASGLNVTLKKQMSVLRFELTLPTALAGQTISYIQIESEKQIGDNSFWSHLNSPKWYSSGPVKFSRIYFSPEITIPSKGKVIAYSIGYYCKQKSGLKLTINANNNKFTIASKEITLSKDFNIGTQGKVHHITATLEE
ncbi:MAG: fimbrillin family protein [Phocaeicola sp.]|uniref:fimbrillin family protein n=1 Tax=Phocaeicola TaxID=909656 RepID=UPI00234F9D56|nr:fimbrillin family protein [Phocaeicola oris]MCE2617168.1 fimbrillin family protein [Phocaeicola oris]